MLLLVTLSEWGGAQHIVYLLAKHLKQNYAITVACAPGGELIQKLGRENISIVSIPTLVRALHPWKDLLTFWKLYRRMKQEPFDLVHTHSTKAGLLGRLAARLAGVKAIVFTAHGWAFTEGRSPWKRKWLALMERFSAFFTNKIICVSAHDRQLALEFKVAKPEQLVVIHNGLDPQPFSQRDKRRAKQEFGWEEISIVTFVGRLASPKEPLVLLEALQHLEKTRVVIVGDGPMRPELEVYAKQYGLSEKVLLLGMREDVPKILAASDIFVLTSRWEGLPLVIIEAMLAGLPVVATQVGGVSELVEDGVTGLLVPRSDPIALAHALKKLLTDETRGQQLGEMGHHRALERFTLAGMLEKYHRLYAELLASNR
jgi:glycosyltransferase involved in cell wall biosynthesis